MKKSSSYIASVASLLALVLAVSGWAYHQLFSEKAEKSLTDSAQAQSAKKQGSADIIEPDNGKRIVVLKVSQKGEGLPPVNGQWLKVHYAGRFENGKEFDNSYKRGKPLKFKFMAGHVIKGFDLGLADMTIGGKRTIKIPPGLAYGERGVPGAIPRNATLIFDLELLGIED